jgi:hypothetical protein
VARMGEECVQGFGENARRKDHLEDQGVDGRMGSASCTMGNGGPFLGGKARPGRDADHSTHLLPRS